MESVTSVGIKVTTSLPNSLWRASQVATPTDLQMSARLTCKARMLTPAKQAIMARTCASLSVSMRGTTRADLPRWVRGIVSNKIEKEREAALLRFNFTFAPWRSIRRAVARPMPWAAPVMRTTLFANIPRTLLWHHATCPAHKVTCGYILNAYGGVCVCGWWWGAVPEA